MPMPRLTRGDPRLRVGLASGSGSTNPTRERGTNANAATDSRRPSLARRVNDRAAFGGALTARELFFEGDQVFSRRCCSYSTFWRRESVARFTLMLIARGLAWSERL